MRAGAERLGPKLGHDCSHGSGPGEKGKGREELNGLEGKLEWAEAREGEQGRPSGQTKESNFSNFQILFYFPNSNVKQIQTLFQMYFSK